MVKPARGNVKLQGAQGFQPQNVKNIIKTIKGLNADAGVVFALYSPLTGDVTKFVRVEKGKGNKIINIPKAKFESEEESLAHIALLADTSSLRIESGKQFLTIKIKIT